MSSKGAASVSGAALYVAKAKDFFSRNRRDLFFGFIALFALSGVIRMELMRNGIIGRPQPQEIQPKVSREFGRSRRENGEH